jgi:hypothetical protein
MTRGSSREQAIVPCALAIIMCWTCAACGGSHFGDIHVSISESEVSYTVSAPYRPPRERSGYIAAEAFAPYRVERFAFERPRWERAGTALRLRNPPTVSTDALGCGFWLLTIQIGRFKASAVFVVDVEGRVLPCSDQTMSSCPDPGCVESSE